MSDILARQRQIIGTSSEWGGFDLILGDGELAHERAAGDTIKFKVGDGVRRFSALPYVAVGGSVGAMTLKGDRDMVGAAAPASPVVGDVYRNTPTVGTTDATWGSQPVNVGTMLVWSGTAWLPLAAQRPLQFKGGANMTAAAPATPGVADVYRNSTAGISHASWGGDTLRSGDCKFWTGSTWATLLGGLPAGTGVAGGGINPVTTNPPAGSGPGWMFTSTASGTALPAWGIAVPITAGDVLLHTGAAWTRLPGPGAAPFGNLVGIAGGLNATTAAPSAPYVGALYRVTTGGVVHASYGAPIAGTEAVAGDAFLWDGTAWSRFVGTRGAMVLRGALNVTIAGTEPAIKYPGDSYTATAAGAGAWPGLTALAINAGDLVTYGGATWSRVSQGTLSGRMLWRGTFDMTAAYPLSAAVTGDTVRATAAGTPHSTWVGAVGPITVGDVHTYDGGAWRNVTGRISGVMIYKGTLDLTVAPPTSITFFSGDVYMNSRTGTAHAGYIGIGGQPVQAGWLAIFNGTTWDVLGSATTFGSFVTIDGSVAMTGNLRTTGLEVQKIGDGTTTGAPVSYGAWFPDRVDIDNGGMSGYVRRLGVLQKAIGLAADGTLTVLGALSVGSLSITGLTALAGLVTISAPASGDTLLVNSLATKGVEVKSAAGAGPVLKLTEGAAAGGAYSWSVSAGWTATKRFAIADNVRGVFPFTITENGNIIVAPPVSGDAATFNAVAAQHGATINAAAGSWTGFGMSKAGALEWGIYNSNAGAGVFSIYNYSRGITNLSLGTSGAILLAAPNGTGVHQINGNPNGNVLSFFGADRTWTLIQSGGGVSLYDSFRALTVMSISGSGNVVHAAPTGGVTQTINQVNGGIALDIVPGADNIGHIRFLNSASSIEYGRLFSNSVQATLQHATGQVSLAPGGTVKLRCDPDGNSYSFSVFAVWVPIEAGATSILRTVNSVPAVPTEQFFVSHNAADVWMGNRRGSVDIYAGNVAAFRVTTGYAQALSGAFYSAQLLANAAPGLILYNDAAYIAFFNAANTVRSGYLQMVNTGAANLVNEVAGGTWNINAGSLIALNAPQIVVGGNRITYNANDTFAHGGVTIPNYGIVWSNNTALGSAPYGPACHIAGYGAVAFYTLAGLTMYCLAGNVYVTSALSIPERPAGEISNWAASCAFVMHNLPSAGSYSGNRASVDRVFDTEYINSTGKAITVYVSSSATNASAQVNAQILVAGTWTTITANFNKGSGAGRVSVSWVVPPGAHYRALQVTATSGLDLWYEI